MAIVDVNIQVRKYGDGKDNWGDAFVHHYESTTNPMVYGALYIIWPISTVLNIYTSNLPDDPTSISVQAKEMEYLEMYYEQRC